MVLELIVRDSARSGQPAADGQISDP